MNLFSNGCSNGWKSAGLAADSGALRADSRINEARRNFKTENKTISG
jgi:hypothetical protein